ncbi:MAG: C-terminal binding protein [Actinomycetota bacterium]|nr:C-terminal binding protein [Actinomycetota bacterium]
MGKYKVVVSDNRHGDYSIEKEILEKCDAIVVVENCFTEEDMIEKCRDADGILLDMAPMTGRVVESLEKCKVISRYGVGYDNVDIEACTRKKIYVANVPDYCEEDVSDLALAHLFACVRGITIRDRLIREGKWNIGRENVFRIKGKTLSLLGFGRIARCLFRKVSGLGLKEVLVYDPYLTSEEIEKAGAKKVDFETALKNADYISLHMPLTPETKGIIDKKAFSLMKKTAIIINTSRGPLIDEEALIDALENKKIAFAGLDTHNVEPLPENSPLKKLDNCVLTDHTGFNTQEAIVELKTKVACNVKDVFENKEPRYWVYKF